ncbi:MAG: heavy metal translocating P-type ATPase [Verrucomicrobiota bacterium]
MSKTSTSACPITEPGKHCIIQLVTEAMREEPAIEAVKIDPGHQAISVATLGKANDAQIEHWLNEQFHKMQDQTAEQCCALLGEKHSCNECNPEVDPKQRARITVQYASGTTTVARQTCPTAPHFWRWRQIPFPKLVPRQVHLPEDASEEDEWKGQLVAASLCGVFGLIAFFVGGPASILWYALSFLAGSWFAAQEVREGLEEGTLDVHFLMLAVAFGSASIGAWAEGATLLFLFSFSGALEHYAMGRTQREIRSLFKNAPKTAILLDAAGNEQSVPVDSLQAGMRLLVKPGEQFPVDAEVVKGKTSSDESNLTGEATPVDKTVGDGVLAGTINLWGSVEVTVLRPASQSALQKIITLIHEAQHLKAPSQRFTDRFGTKYTYAILGLSLAMFFVWWLGFGHTPFKSTELDRSAFYRTMTLLVVASPCALVLSIPSAVLAAIAWSAKRGILFRGGAAVENLASIQVVAMDKTGTLTTGELQVDRVESFPPGREREVAQLAFSLERLSTHPLARAITRHGKHEQLSALELEQFESVTGLGLKAQYQGQWVRLGRREWVADGPNVAVLAKAPPTEAGYAEVWIEHGQLVGRVLMRDDIRPAAREVVEKLRALGLKTVMLTGDHQASADKLQKELALDEVRAGLKPEQKVDAVAGFSKAGQKVAMIGDGVNDAPSLAAADVGVAMGARGSDAALEQAEVVLMHDRLENFLTAFQLSQRARQVIRQNVAISLGTVVVLVGCALFGTIPLTVGVIGHEGSTVLVVMNSLRLLMTRGPAALKAA